MLKRILIVEDLSGFGQISLNTAITTISDLGELPCPLPTEYLSTHTGGFGKPAVIDLSSIIKPASEHWQTQAIEFDGFYFGYLGQQALPQVLTYIKPLTKQSFLLVDPVMGDQGRLYANFDEGYVSQMRQLIQGANLITPNLTEACLLLDIPFPNAIDCTTAEQLANNFKTTFAVDQVIITDLPISSGEIGIISYGETVLWTKTVKREAHLIGTGDFLASLLIGLTLKGYNQAEALNLATETIQSAIDHTLALQGDLRDGLNFVPSLLSLIDQLKEG